MNHHRGKVARITEKVQPQLNITLYSSSDHSHHGFCVPAEMQVGDFLELALERLAQGEGAERVRALRENYQPVLEMPSAKGGRELPDDVSLTEAGVCDHTICRIVARPRKECIMFCRYAH